MVAYISNFFAPNVYISNLVVSNVYFIERERERKKKKKRYVSVEVVEEILVRLPVKSLYRLKSVSKTWRSLIESRSFMDFHTRRHYHDYTHDHLALVQLVQEEGGPMVRAMGPLSNGVYCLVDTPPSRIWLCNMAAQNNKFSPIPYDDELSHALAQKPCRVHYGFGNIGDDHKVIIILSWGPFFSSFLSFVYSSIRDEWRKIGDLNATNGLVRGGRYPEITEDLEVCLQRFYNGRWHWMAVHEGEDGAYPCSILSFDLHDEAFRLMGAPEEWEFDEDDVGEMDGCLRGAWALVLNDHLGAIAFPDPCSSIHVYMMMEYGVQESWTVIYVIDPNFYDDLSRLVGIAWTSPSDGNGNGGNCVIKGIEFESSDVHGKKWVTCNGSGYQERDPVVDLSSAIYFNTCGISVFRETLYNPF